MYNCSRMCAYIINITLSTQGWPRCLQTDRWWVNAAWLRFSLFASRSKAHIHSQVGSVWLILCKYKPSASLSGSGRTRFTATQGCLTSHGTITGGVGKRFNVAQIDHLTHSLLSLRPHPRSWPLPGFPPLSLSISSNVPHPLLLHGRFESNPPPLPPPLALTQAYCPCSAAAPNSDCWLVVETEKEVLGVFIETPSFTRTITTLPHTKTEKEANWLLVSHLRQICITWHWIWWCC